MRPLIVLDEIYDVISDVFLAGKSLASVCKSCVDLFTAYPPTWRYQRLALVK